MLQQRKENRMTHSNGNGFQAPKSRGVAIPIPAKVGKKPTNVASSDFFSSSDGSASSSSNSDSPPLHGYPQLSSSHHGTFHTGSSANLPLNVYGTSPRTSVMFNYYNSPKGSYSRPHQLLTRTRSTDAPQALRSSQTNATSSQGYVDFPETNWDKSERSETISLLPRTKAKAPAGISAQHFQQLDQRPRAWSESDKNRSNNQSSIQSSRMSALRKLRRKLGQKGSLKRQKSQDDEKNRSATSMTSLEKVEEGRQLHCSTPLQIQNMHASGTEKLTLPKAPSSSLHQEHETRKKSERRLGVVKYPGLAPPHGVLPQVKENPEAYLIYQRFLEEHTCYDMMPTSSKLVVLDTRLEVRKAFHAIIENSLRCAPLWDNDTGSYVGLLTVSDFVSILLAYHNCPNRKLEDLENQKISGWRTVLNAKKTLIHLPPQSSLFDALKRLTEENIRRLAIVHPGNGDIFHVINHRRILHFLHLFMNELPKPNYMTKTVGELGIGTRGDVATISEDSPVIDALNLIATHKVSGLPVTDAQGRVTDMFTKTDVLVLAGEQLFYDLSIKVKDVISLHSAIDADENKPAVMRTMPGSPALVRRKNQPRHSGHHSHPQNSTPVQQFQNHSFLRNSNNTPKNLPSPLVTSSMQSGLSYTNSNDQQKGRDKHTHHHSQSKGHQGSQALANEQSHGKGDSLVVSPPSSQPFLHRRRHLSSHISRSTSVSSHLVTVTQEDTLESVVNNVVTADVLQAVIVDDFDHVKGVISIGDILRFMVYPTEMGQMCKRADTVDGNSVINDKKTKHKGTAVTNDGDSMLVGQSLSPQQSRIRATSDDSDFVSADHDKFSSHNKSRSPTACAPSNSSLDSGVSFNFTETSPKVQSASGSVVVEASKSTGAGGAVNVDSLPMSSLGLQSGGGTVQDKRRMIPLEQATSAHMLASGEEMKRL